MEQELKESMEQELYEARKARKAINKRVMELEEIVRLRVEVRALTEVIKAINNTSKEYRDEIDTLRKHINGHI